MNRREPAPSLLVVAFVVGAAIPPAIVHALDLSYDERVFGGYATSMLVFSYITVLALEEKLVALRHLVERSHIFAYLGVMLFSLLGAIFAIAFAVVPVPYWLHMLVAGILALVAFGVLMVKKL